MFNMWRFYIFISVLMAWSSLQVEGQKNNKLDWNIKLNVPGDAGRDYPTLDAIPRTHFSCAGREPGYYADQETNCQVFRICTAGTTYGFQSFLCPNGTLFNQAVFVCDWWMNVNCQQEIQNNIERFENLKPGPQLLKDVRKMITYPMRNPISNGFVKNNFLVTQTYKPPSELLYPNGALTSSHNNVLYVPSKESFGEHLSNDISFAASTSSPLYSLYRGHQSSQNVQFFNKQSAENTKEDQANVYRTNTPSPTQTTLYGPTNYNKLDSYDNRNSKAFNNQKQQLDFESYRTNQAQSLHAKNNNLINVEAQQNLDLVFSFLADSLNAAKDYNNIVKQNVITTPTPQVQNYRYSNAEDITRKISELTSTQFTNNNVNSHKTKKIIPPSSQANSQQKAAATRNHHNRPQNAYYHQRQQTPVQKLSHTHSQIRPVDSRLPTINSRIKNLRPTSNHIYSGQLYQHPVPEVTRDYYNLPNIKNNLFTLPKLNGHKNFRPQISNKKQNLPDIEVIPSQQSPFNNRLAQMSNQETFQEHVEPPKLSSFLSSTNGITAQVQDTIRGTLSHPFDNDKQLTYNKDQSFYIFSQLNNNHENNRVNEEINDQLQLQKSNNEKIDTLGLQLIPSIGYKLNDERDKERILSTFQLNEFGSPTGSENLYQEDLTTNVDYSVKHPSSYGASSFTQNQSQRFKNKNSNIEDLDAPEPNGYPKISPQPEFNT